MTEYTIDAYIGRGATAEIFRARWVAGDLGGTVALKILRADVAARLGADDPARASVIAEEAARRLRDEGRLLGALADPHIVRVLEVTHFEGRPCVVMEYVDGSPLRGHLASGPLAPRRAVTAARQVAGALRAMREQMADTAHRDIKPDNILIERSTDAAKLIDFGAATFQLPGREGDTTFQVGSFGYCAPERTNPRDGVGHDPTAGDIFSLGVTLVECLVGVPVGHAPATARGHTRWRAQLLEHVRGVVGPNEALLALLRAMIARPPEDRPPIDRLPDLLEQVASTLPRTGPLESSSLVEPPVAALDDTHPMVGRTVTGSRRTPATNDETTFGFEPGTARPQAATPVANSGPPAGHASSNEHVPPMATAVANDAGLPWSVEVATALVMTVVTALGGVILQFAWYMLT